MGDKELEARQAAVDSVKAGQFRGLFCITNNCRAGEEHLWQSRSSARSPVPAEFYESQQTNERRAVLDSGSAGSASHSACGQLVFDSYTMKTIEYRFVDKSSWEGGPWNEEPDKVQWQDESTGLPCLAVRGPLGNWCGYVGVFEGHPWFGKEYDAEEVEIACHGGLTYSAFCQAEGKQHGICHLVGPDEPDQVWWFGFDCGHVFDLSPGQLATLKSIGLGHGLAHAEDIYRPLAYVQQQCAKIAAQLKAADKEERLCK